MWKKVGAVALMLLTGPLSAQTDWRNQAVPVYSYATFVRMQDTHWYALRTVEFVRRVEGLQQALDAHCQGGLAIPSRQAWREALVAWSRLSTVAVGPLVERRSARRIDFQPTRPELIEQAVAATAEGKLDMDLVGSAARGFPALEWLLWAQPARAAAPAHTPAPTPALRGGRKGKSPQALSKPSRKAAAKTGAKASSKAKASRRAEWITLPMLAALPPVPPPAWLNPVPSEGLMQVSLKTKATAKPAAKSSTKASKAAAKPGRGAGRSAKGRRGAVSVPAAAAPALGQAASALSRTTSPAACKFAQALTQDLHAEGMALAEGFAKRLEGEPEAEDAVITERLNDALNQWLGGLEQLRMQALERPVLEMAADQPRARPNLPRALSGTSALDRQARWSALRSLVAFDGPVAPEPDTALIPLETLLRSQGLNPLADKLHEAATEVDKALEAALENTPETLQAAGRSMATLHSLVADEVAAALDVRIGFSDADGD